MAVLLAIDGHSWIHRAIHIKTRTAAPDIFAGMIQSMIGRFRPEYVMSALDGPRSELLRREWWPTYKSHRKTLDEQALNKIEACEHWLAEAGIATAKVHRWEADDVLATIARVCAGSSCTVIIATADKDLGQCVTDHVHLWNGTKYWRVHEIRERWGVDPEKIPHIQALSGDSCDHLPGAKGIGAKTAKKCIQDYGTVEGTVNNRHKLSPARKAALEGFDWRLHLKLVTLNDRLRVPLHVDDLVAQ